MNRGWKVLKGINLNDFVSVEAFKLEVDLYVANCELDLDFWWVEAPEKLGCGLSRVNSKS